MSFLKLDIIKLALLRFKYVSIRAGNGIKILGKMPFVKMYDGSTLVIGNNVVLNSDLRNSNTALTTRCKFVIGYTGKLEIGDNTMLNGVSITAYKNVAIGRNCQIASSSLITDTDFHPTDPKIRLLQVTGQKYDLDFVNKENVIIGNNVWIGWGAIILKGTIIGDNSIVAAGSVVLGEFPSNVIIAGNPAKIVKCI